MAEAHGYLCSVEKGDQVATRPNPEGGKDIRCMFSLQPRAANEDFLLQAVDVLQPRFAELKTGREVVEHRLAVGGPIQGSEWSRSHRE